MSDNADHENKPNSVEAEVESKVEDQPVPETDNDGEYRPVNVPVNVNTVPPDMTDPKVPQCHLTRSDGKPLLTCETVEDMNLAIDALTKEPVRVRVEAHEQSSEGQPDTNPD